MSLLDHDTRDTVVLYPEVDGTDALGNPRRVPDLANPVEVRGRVQPGSSNESDIDGQAVSTTYVLRCREFPAGAFARATWEGREWDVVGEPARRNGSETTRHVTILLGSRAPEAVHD